MVCHSVWDGTTLPWTKSERRPDGIREFKCSIKTFRWEKLLLITRSLVYSNKLQKEGETFQQRIECRLLQRQIHRVGVAVASRNESVDRIFFFFCLSILCTCLDVSCSIITIRNNFFPQWETIDFSDKTRLTIIASRWYTRTGGVVF